MKSFALPALRDTRIAIESGEIKTARELELFLLNYPKLLLQAERAGIFRQFANVVDWSATMADVERLERNL